MNRKVTNRFFAGLCISLGLMACTQNLEQERYSDLIVGLEGDEITLYPLGETLRFPVYYSEYWDLDVYERPNGVAVTKEDNAVELVANSNFDEDRSGSFDIVYTDNVKTINVFQDAVRFSITDKEGEIIEDNSEYVVQGGEISFGISSNVNFMIRSPRADFKIIDTTATSFKVDASSTPAKNGEDISGSIYVDLYDKHTKYREVENHYVITLLQKAFHFRWTDTPVAEQEDERSFDVDFNDRDSQSFGFKSSGKWRIQNDAQWLDVKDYSGKILSAGEPGEYTICLSANEMNEDNKNKRTGKLKIITDDYPDDPLVINLTQGKAPEIGLTTYNVKLKENETFDLGVSVDVDDYKVKWEVTEGNDIVRLSSTNYRTITVTALTEGQAKIVATITVDGHSMTTDPCEVSVYREYNGGNTGEEIGDDEGEW